jgi:hypothetical protein
MVFTIDAEKVFDKINIIFMEEALMKLGILGMCLNIIKTIYDKPLANIILNGVKLKLFPLKSRMTRVSTLSTLIQIVLEFLVRAIR